MGEVELLRRAAAAIREDIGDEEYWKHWQRDVADLLEAESRVVGERRHLAVAIARKYLAVCRGESDE